MIEKVRSHYLRDELKYDRWGAQGKLLVTVEVFRREGVVMDGEKLLRFVNLAFPRTFSCQRKPVEGEALPSRETLHACRNNLLKLFDYYDLPADRVSRLVMEETAERFCLDTAFLTKYLK